MKVTFITGNEHKAKWMSKYLDYPIIHKKVELDEIQSLDLHTITEHKVRQAYELVGAPVLVEDIALCFDELNELPGPLVKWFLQELKPEGLCRLLNGYASRKATAKITFAYYDGDKVEFFNGEVQGVIADHPRGDDFGWNPIFIPNGSTKTYAEMSEEEQAATGLRTTTVFPKIKQFFLTLDSN